MLIRNTSTRSIVLRDTGGSQYIVPANSDLTLSDSLWSDTEFRRWIRYRIRDVIIDATGGGLEAPAFAASYTPNVALGSTKNPGVITAAMTINVPTNPSNGAVLEFFLTQDGTGGRAVTWNGIFIFQVAWTNTGNTANKRSYARFIYNGTNWISTVPVANIWF